MHAGALCIRNPICIAADTTVKAAAEEMHARQVGSLIVADTAAIGSVPRGIVTDRDLVTRIMAFGRDAGVTTVAKVMSYPLVTCQAETELSEAIRTMRARGVRRLPVLDAGGNLIGILTADDALAALAEELSDLARALMTDREARPEGWSTSPFE
jgi:CBS domain-containing protein